MIPFLKRSPIRKRRPGKPRRGPAGVPPEEWRNPKYLRFLREQGKCLPCERRGITEDFLIDVATTCSNRGVALLAERRLLYRHHIDPMHGPPNGRGQKGPDAGAIPGCRYHHDEQTNMPGGWPAFEEKYSFSRAKEAEAHYALFKMLEASEE